MGNYIGPVHEGQGIAPVGGVSREVPIVVGNQLRLPLDSALEGEGYAYVTVGRYELAKSGGFSFNDGQLLYWNADDNNLVPNGQGFPCGFAYGDAAESATTAQVQLLEDKTAQFMPLLQSMLGGIYQVTFVGSNGAGNITPTVKTDGATPAANHQILSLQGYVTATGVPVAMPEIGTDFDAELTDDAGTAKVVQASDTDLSDNTYTALILPVPNNG